MIFDNIDYQTTAQRNIILDIGEGRGALILIARQAMQNHMKPFLTLKHKSAMQMNTYQESGLLQQIIHNF